jgi:hypothetical protein
MPGFSKLVQRAYTRDFPTKTFKAAQELLVLER